MNLTLKRSFIAGLAFCCSTSLLTPFSTAYADNNITEIENITSDLQSQLSGINSDLVKISDDISSTQMQIDITNNEIMRTQDNLVVAQENEAKQYESMKTRIKYMYETDNSSLLELLFSAQSMSDFLNKADFIQNISSYDRDMLVELQQIRSEIKEKKDTLDEQYSSLNNLESSLTDQQSALQTKANETSTNLADFQSQLQQLREAEAKRQAEEAAAKAAKEAAEKAAKEAAEKAAKEAAEQQAAANKAQESASAQTSSQNSSADSSQSTAAATTPSNSSEIDLFAALLQCEAYQDYDSLLAVATVIMNRLSDSRFPGTITEIIYAPGQFEPTWSGRLNSVLSSGATSLSYQVAQDALNGSRLSSVSDCYYFLYAGGTSKKGVIVGDNVFFQSW